MFKFKLRYNINDIRLFSEWRNYNNDSNNNTSDTSRCGQPINPLLIESSFGCKVLCSNNSSYEMKKIRKWTEWQSIKKNLCL